MVEKVKIFVTGGTFDKHYDEIKQKLVFNDTSVPQVLKQGRCLVQIEIRTLMMVDSLDMTETERLLILDQCQNAVEDRIIVTHGTDTMAVTAQLLGEKIKDKTIVFTGAMTPYAFGSSDGLFNLGCAIAFVQTLSSGVYIAMNGLYFPWYNVKKEKESGNFSPLNS